MSNHKNHRRSEDARTEHGPRWENPDPGKGCNSTHVARCRSYWKKLKNRTLRRTGNISPKYHSMGVGLPEVPEIDNGDVA